VKAKSITEKIKRKKKKKKPSQNKRNNKINVTKKRSRINLEACPWSGYIELKKTIVIGFSIVIHEYNILFKITLLI